MFFELFFNMLKIKGDQHGRNGSIDHLAPERLNLTHIV